MENNTILNELPYIASNKRLAPNEFIRSNLFSISNHKQAREYYRNKELYSLAKSSITYTGDELRQDDEDVWMQIIFNCSKNSSLNIDIQPYTFLRALSWPGKSHYKEKLKDSLTRMSATSINILNRESKEGLSISLIRKFIWHDEKGDSLKTWSIWIEPELAKLFEKYQYTKLFWEQRKELKPLGKWLHSYYSSHSIPIPVPVELLRKGTGSKAKQFKTFKESLKEALIDLVKIGFLDDYWIDADNNVNVIRNKPKYNLIQNH